MAGKLPRLPPKELARRFLGLRERIDREAVRVAGVVRRAKSPAKDGRRKQLAALEVPGVAGSGAHVVGLPVDAGDLGC